MLIEARGKINWTLNILGVREDGYHFMDMLMQPVSLCDYVTIEKADSLELHMSGYPHLRADETNIAMKAARKLSEFSGICRGASISIEKHLPVGAGMAGGSADAAAVLAGLNQIWNLNFSQNDLESIAISIGADVPFCLRGGLTRTSGIGESIQNLVCKYQYWLVVIQPCRGLSTGEIFTEWKETDKKYLPDTEKAVFSIQNGLIDQFDCCLGNVLQQVSEKHCPEIADAVCALKNLGAAAALMTGSGSAVYGVFKNAMTARSAAQKLKCRWTKTYMCHTCRESLMMQNRLAEE